MNNTGTVVHSQRLDDDDYKDFEQGRTNFRNDKIKGNFGEQMFATFMQQNGYTCNHTPEVYPYDFDLIYPDGARLRIDVKANFKDDGFLIFEEWHSTGIRKGWVYEPDVDLWVFVSIQTGNMVWVRADAVREHWASIKEPFTLIRNSTNTRNWYVSSFYKIPIPHLISVVGNGNVDQISMN